MSFIKDLFKKGILGSNQKIEETPISLSQDEINRLKNGEAVIVEHSKGMAVLKIKSGSLKKTHITNEDIDIRQVASSRSAAQDADL